MKSTVVIVNSRFLQRPQKPKSREPPYSQTLYQNIISIDSGSRSRKSCIITVRRTAIRLRGLPMMRISALFSLGMEAPG